MNSRDAGGQQHLDTLHRAAHEAVREGRLREAHQHCLALLAIDPNFSDAWFLCGVIAAHNGQINKSVDIFRKAIALAPANPAYLAELGKQFVMQRDIHAALNTAQQALALAPVAAPVLNTLGTVFSHCGDHATGLSCFEHATRHLRASNTAADKAWQADLWFNYGASLQFAGHVDAAENAYEQAIMLQPRMYRSHSALSLLRTQSADHNHLARLQSLRDTIATPKDQLHVGHAIAKEQEDLHQYHDSLTTLDWAKAAQARQVGYSANTDAAIFSAIRGTFTPAFFATARVGCDSPEPIFIVGMPRTGTTLVEQILAGHSRVHAAGELPYFPLLVKHHTGTTSHEVVDADTFSHCTRLDVAELGAAYLHSASAHTRHTAHFIDKLPLNFLYLGLIKRALPNAKLICLRRDPMDTCLSNYRQLFATNFKYYNYNLDLLDCGRYFIQFDRLMRHWRETLPGAVYEVQYESLVAEPERVIKELLAHCRLPWEEQCLDFHQRKTSVATPSAVQVRQGIYTSSVQHWRRYGDAVQPLFGLLQAAGFYSRAG